MDLTGRTVNLGGFGRASSRGSTQHAFFVVIEESDSQSRPYSESPDWPSAKAFVEGRISLRNVAQ